MRTYIFVAGAPGSGKSTVSAMLQEKLGTPLFEFGWIPEFRNTGTRTTSYSEDEALAFENLTLVLKNYARHGFKNIVVTDLDNKRIAELDNHFSDEDYLLITLRVLKAERLKGRVLDESRSSGYRDWQSSLRINQGLLERSPFAQECFIDIEEQSVNEVVEQILERL